MTLARYLALATLVVAPGLVLSIMITPSATARYRAIDASFALVAPLLIDVTPDPAPAAAAATVTWDLPVAQNARGNRTRGPYGL